jgi:hypothetical protein
VGQEYWVATNGNDANAGSKSKPFASLERARDAVREAKKAGLPKGGVTVWLKGGIYELNKTFELNEQDSGTADAPIVYRAAPGEEVRLTGGKQIPSSAFTLVTDPAILARLPEEERGKVWQVDLKIQGITDFGSKLPRGWGHAYTSPGLEVFFNDQPLQLARWPNEGMVPIGQILDPGGVPRTQDDFTDRGGTFSYEGDRPSRWAQAEDIWLAGFFALEADTLRVKSIDLEARTITMDQSYRFGLVAGRPYYALNLLEEIDIPGEWYLDRKSGILYLCPPSDIAAARVEVSLLEAPLVALEGVSHLTLRELTLQTTRGLGVYIERGNSNLLVGCTLRNFGTVAICMGQGVKADPSLSPGANMDLNARYGYILQNGADRGERFEIKPVSRELGDYQMALYADTIWNRQAGTNHGVIGCDIYNTGAGGVILSGGDRKTLTPGGNYILNCHIHHFNRLDRSFCAAVNMDGVGNRVAHCLIHDATLGAIFLRGNDHVIEFNDVYNVCQLGESLGAFYYGRDPSEQGNIFRHNFVHHTGNPEKLGYGPWAIYSDDGACGLNVIGNVFYKILNSSVHINGGHDHTFRNNIFVDNPTYIECGKNNESWSAFVHEPLQLIRLRKAIDITQPPYSTRYPLLADTFETDPDYPRGQVFHDNLLVRPGEFKAEGNDVKKNWVTDEDPGFVDMARMNFQLKADSPVFQKISGFQPIPFDRIGLYIDDYRTSLPDKFK